MTIQTFVIEHRYRGDVDTQVVNCIEEEVENYCIAKSKNFNPGEESIEYDTLENWVARKTNPDSYFLKEFKELTQPKKGIWWLAVPDVTELIGDIEGAMWWGKQAVKRHHVTLAFDVRHVDYPEIYMFNPETGDTPVFVKGLAYNDKCAALVVEVPASCCNKHPHITLATADGVPPVYSNDMLAGKDGAYSFLPLEAELEGQLEFFEFS